jgi:hypothetical protein
MTDGTSGTKLSIGKRSKAVAMAGKTTNQTRRTPTPLASAKAHRIKRLSRWIRKNGFQLAAAENATFTNDEFDPRYGNTYVGIMNNIYRAKKVTAFAISLKTGFTQISWCSHAKPSSCCVG